METINICTGIERIFAISLLCSLIAYFIFFMFYASLMYNALFFINVALIFTLNKVVTNSKKTVSVDFKKAEWRNEI